MRTLLAWVAGLTVCFLIGRSFEYLGSALGVRSVYEFYSRAEGFSSNLTSYGYLSTAFALVAALFAGKAAYHRRFSIFFTKRECYGFAAWLMALGVLVVLFVLVNLAFKSFHNAFTSFLKLLVELLAVLGAAWASHQCFKNRVKNLKHAWED